MKRKKEIVIAITIAGALVFCLTLVRAIFYAPTDEIPLPEGATLVTALPASYPVRMTIPKLKINANVVDVGITSRKNMGTPDNYSEVGWYRYGPAPGDTGSAVMAGHVDNGLSLPGVFAELGNLAIGDDVYVSNRGGENLHFVVSKIDTYDYDARDTDVFTESDGKFIKLVTCVGTWSSYTKTHDQRLVVTALLAPPKD